MTKKKEIHILNILRDQNKLFKIRNIKIVQFILLTNKITFKKKIIAKILVMTSECEDKNIIRYL